MPPRKPDDSVATKDDAARRQKSDDAKLEKGEMRLTNWINREATQALRKIIGKNPERGAIKATLEEAILELAKIKTETPRASAWKRK
jgi:hypothetical protein